MGNAQDQYFTGIIRDLTERKRLEETTRQQEMQLIQANKMTALGTLVSGVAHEINNPNQLVLLNAQVLANAWADAIEVLDGYAQHEGGLTLAGLPLTLKCVIPFRRWCEISMRAPNASSALLTTLRILRVPVHLVGSEVLTSTRLWNGHYAYSRIHRSAYDAVPHASRIRVPPIHGDTQQVEQVVVNLVVTR